MDLKQKCEAFAKILTYLLVVSLAGCYDSVKDSLHPQIPPAKTTEPLTCENGNTFIKTSEVKLHDTFFIGNSDRNVFSCDPNYLYKYGFPELRYKSRVQLGQHSYLEFVSRDETSGWLFTRNTSDGKLYFHLIDTSLSFNLTRPVLIEKSIYFIDNVKITLTDEGGFVVVAYELKGEGFIVQRYSTQGTLTWERQLPCRCTVNAIQHTRQGITIGVSIFLDATSTTSKPVIFMFDESGKEIINKTVEPEEPLRSYRFIDIAEDEQGDYYVLFYKMGTALSVMRLDGTFTSKWSANLSNAVINNTDARYYGQAMKSNWIRIEGSEVIVDFSAGDIYLTSISKQDGKSQWISTFGGTGDEFSYWLRPTTTGYYLVGATWNWDGVYLNPSIKSYLIKTDLQGRSCN